MRATSRRLLAIPLPLPRSLRRGALEVEGEQARQRLLGRDVLRPAVGGGDGAVEFVMRVGEPARTLVVEIGQRALFELDGRLGALWQDAVGVAARRLARRGGRRDFGDDVDEIGRIEPARRRSSSFFAAAAMRRARGSSA